MLAILALFLNAKVICGAVPPPQVQLIARSIATPKPQVSDIKISGTNLYAAVGSEFVIADISTHTNAKILSRIDVGAPIRNIALSQSKPVAYLACGPSGIKTIDITNLSSPILVSTALAGEDVITLRAADSFGPPQLFAAIGDRGVVALDILNRAQPTYISRYQTAGPTVDLEFCITPNVRGVFVATRDGGALILDATDAANMTPFRVFRGSGNIFRVWRDGLNMWFASDSRDVYSVDLQDPLLPFSYTTPLPFTPTRILVTALTGFGYVFGESKDVYFQFGRNGFNVTLGGQKMGAITAVGSTTTYEAVAEADVGIWITRTRAGTGLLQVNGATSTIHPAGDRVYASSGIDGLRVFQLSSANSLQEVGKYNAESSRPFAVFGSNVFYLSSTNAKILDFTTPSSPTVLSDPTSMITLLGEAARPDDVLVTGTRAFISSQNAGITVLDISNPSNPSPSLRSGTIGLNGGAWRDMTLVGTNLFIANGGPLCYSVDANNQVHYVFGVSTEGRADGVFIRNSRAYVADHIFGLKIFDISQPASMKFIASCETRGNARRVEVAENLAFVANSFGGVAIIDISDDSHPTLLTSIPTTNQALDVRLQGSKLFVSEGYGGVSVWQVSGQGAQTITLGTIPALTTRTAPFQLSPSASSGLPVSVTAQGPILFVNGFITTTNAGTLRIVVTQSGNNDFAPAVLDQSFPITQVARDAQQLIFPQLVNVTEVDEFPYEVTASSGLPVTITSLSGPAHLAWGILSLTNSGSLTIKASQDGDRDFAPVSGQQTVAIRDLASLVAEYVREGNPSLTGEALSLDADPDGDGLPNVVEFILGSDPLSATSKAGRTTASFDGQNLIAKYAKPRTRRWPFFAEVFNLANPFSIWMRVDADINMEGGIIIPVKPGDIPVVRFGIEYP